MEGIYDGEAEQSLIGCLLIEPQSFYLSGVMVDDFYVDANKQIWRAANDLLSAGKNVDAITLLERINAVGGDVDKKYLYGCLTSVPSALNATDYGRIVLDNADRRNALTAFQDGAKRAFDKSQPFDPSPYCQDALRSVRFTARRTNKENCDNYLDWYLDRISNPRDLSGMDTGIKGINKMTDGFELGTTILLSGQEGLGKSMLAAQIALNIARFKLGVVLYTLEISDTMIYNRWVSTISGVEAWEIKHGHLTDIQQSLVQDAVDQLSGLPIHIVKDDRINTSQIQADIMRRKASGEDVSFVVVDYAGKLSDQTSKGVDELDQKAENITRMVGISQRMNFAGLLIHTLNANDGVAGRRKIRYDVDVALNMYRSESAPKGLDGNRYVTLEATKLRDQNSVGFASTCNLIRNDKFPYFVDEV